MGGEGGGQAVDVRKELIQAAIRVAFQTGAGVAAHEAFELSFGPGDCALLRAEIQHTEHCDTEGEEKPVGKQREHAAVPKGRQKGKVGGRGVRRVTRPGEQRRTGLALTGGEVPGKDISDFLGRKPLIQQRAGQLSVSGVKNTSGAGGERKGDELSGEQQKNRRYA